MGIQADVFDVFYYCSLLISAAAGCAYYKKTDLPYKWLTTLMILTLVSELIAKYIAFGIEISNSVVYHIFTPIEYTIYVIIFINFIQNNKLNILLWTSALLLLLFEIGNTIFFQPLQETNTNTMIAESTLLVILSLRLFLKIRATPSQQNILKRGDFWFASAVLCYYAFNILIWGFHSMKVYLLDNPPQIIYNVNMLLSGFLYITFITAIILNSMPKHQTP